MDITNTSNTASQHGHFESNEHSDGSPPPCRKGKRATDAKPLPAHNAGYY